MKRLLPLLFIATGFFNQQEALAQPANDLCADAIPITCGQTLSGNTIGGTAGSESCSYGKDAWYTFIGDGSDVTLSMCSGGTTIPDTWLAVYSGTCGSLVCEASNDDDSFCGFSGFMSTLTMPTVCGEQYYVSAGSLWSGDEGNFDLSMTCAAVGGIDNMSVQDVTVQLDAAGNYTFDTPLDPYIDGEVTTSNGGTTNTLSWQSFTPTVDAIIQSVTLTFTTVPTGPIFINLFPGQGTGGGQLLGTDIPVTGIVALTPITIDIAPTLDLLAGTEYSLGVRDGSLNPFTLQRDDSNPYVGGISSAGASTDLQFAFRMLERPEVDNGTTDDDGIDHWELSQTSFDCSDAGTVVPITFTGFDNLGNSSVCIVNVTVEDNISPTVSCVGVPTPVTNNYANGTLTALTDLGTVSSTINVPDDIDITDVNVNLDITHSYVGDLTVTLESPNGGTITLIDRIGEPAIGIFGCSDDGVLVTIDDAGGSAIEDACTYTPAQITGTFTGTDLLSTFNATNATGDWILTITDNAGGDFGDLVGWSIDVSGNLSLPPVQFVLDPLGDHLVDPNTIDAGSDDICGYVLSTVPASFDCSDVGPQSITLTATDPSGNASSCVTTVEVVDNTPPTMACQNLTVYLDGNGYASIDPSDIDNGSDDACGMASLALDVFTFNCGNTGANPVILTGEDVNGNTATCSAVVTVEDTIRPIFTYCPTDIEVCSDDDNGAFITYTSPTFDDNCGGATLAQVDGLTPGQVFPIGRHIQQYQVTDASGLTRLCTFYVTVQATPIPDYTYSPACQGEAIFFTDESTIVGPATIETWSWDMDDGSGPITLVDPIHQFAALGDYDVALTVVSDSGCSATVVQTISVTPVPVASFSVDEDCEGNATVFTNTSTPGLNYAWDFGDGSAIDNSYSPSHVYLIDGTYTVTMTVTSDEGCEDVATASVNVDASPTALFTASTVCEGTATVFTNLSTGGSGLTHIWDFGDSNGSIDPSTSHIYATDGSYTVTLTTTNSLGCSDMYSVVVTVNNLPDVSFTYDNSFGNVCEDVAVNFVNTSSPGSSNWDLGDGSSSTLANVSHAYTTFGFYDVTLTVTSPQFCINSATQTIEIFDLPDFTLAPTDLTCYNDASGSIEVVPAGTPAAPWSLSLNGGTPQTSSVFFNDLDAGSYEVTVEDNNGCVFSVQTIVDQPDDTLGIVLNNIVDILCHGTATGVIDVSGSGGTSGYNYQINGGGLSSSGIFTGLEADGHDVQIVDNNGCIFDTTITLTEPDTLVLAYVSQMDLLCNGDNTGEITVLGTGGILDYEYNINGAAYDTAASFTGLPAGLHIVGVLDDHGCTDTLHVTLTEPGVLQLSLDPVDPFGHAQCFGEANGYIKVVAASGTSPYQYSLNGVNFQGSGSFAGLAAGIYTVVVKDAHGCLDEIEVEIEEPTQLIIETSSVPVACFGDATGSIQIIASGGTTDYSYSINGGTSFVTTASFTGLPALLPAGTPYYAVVKDANGCSASEGVIISQPASAFELTSSVTPVGCIGESTGVITLIGTGGTPTYTYSDDNISFNTPNTFSGYAEGTYTLYGRDLNGCEDSEDVFVSQPATAVQIIGTLLSDPTCPNVANGMVTVQATGGTPGSGYMYSSNGGTTYQGSSILNNVGSGAHLIMVMDANGCLASEIVELEGPAPFNITGSSTVDVECEGDLDGEIHLVVTGGTPSYTYSLNGGNAQTNGDFLNLGYGTYDVTVVDVNSCIYNGSISVDADQLQPVAAFDYFVVGEAVAFTNQSQNGVSYMWDFNDGTTSTNVSPNHVYANPGGYWVSLTATNECGSSTVSVFVSTINTGIDEEEEITFGLFPNPASSELFLKASANFEDAFGLDVISTDGKLIRSMTQQRLDAAGMIRIDLNGIAQGVYYLRILTDKNQAVLRFDIIK